MDRRTFLTSVAGLLAVPLATEAQQAGKVWRIGALQIGPILVLGSNPIWDAFLQSLRELGYVEGQNISIEQRSAEGRMDRLPALAAELVRLNVDVIVVPNTQATLAAKHATTTIPIVMAAPSDPVETGLISSFARPGGNITGLTDSGGKLAGKRLQLLKEVIPKLSRVTVLADPTNLGNIVPWRETQIAAEVLRVELQRVDASVPEEIERAFATIGKQRVDALIVFASPMFYDKRRRIGELITKSHLPAMFGMRGHVAEGGLMSYAPSYSDLYRRVAIYVDKILKGAKPADLPVEQATKFELVLNLKTAKALGLTLPPSLLQRADQVIE